MLGEDGGDYSFVFEVETKNRIFYFSDILDPIFFSTPMVCSGPAMNVFGNLRWILSKDRDITTVQFFELCQILRHDERSSRVIEIDFFRNHHVGGRCL